MPKKRSDILCVIDISDIKWHEIERTTNNPATFLPL
jgi:hypothetical protein